MTSETKMPVDENQELNSNVLNDLARFALILSEDIPVDVKEQAKLCILDTVGCMVSGIKVPEYFAVRSAELALGTGDGELSHLGQARLLGYLGDVLELNDLIGGHASIGIVTAVLSTAWRLGSSLEDVVDAVVVGNEVTARLYEACAWTKKPYTDSGMVIPSLVSAFGAAAALARLRGFSEKQTADSMSMAATLTSWGPAEVIFGDGGTVKPFLFGSVPADAAIRAMAYAEYGLTGPPRIIDSPIGLMAALAESFDATRISSSDRWYLRTPQRKLHASCGYTHSSIDAVVELVKSRSDLASAKSIRIHVPEYLLDAVWKSEPPRTSNEARFHLQYCVALAATGSKIIEPRHMLDFEDYIHDADVARLLQSISIEAGSFEDIGQGKPYNSSEVTIEFENGEILRGGCSAPRGSAGNALSPEDVVAKFSRNSDGLLAPEVRESVVGLLVGTGRAGDLQPLWSLVDFLTNPSSSAL
ncbi:hypothetical protein B5P43_32795 [Bacillus sp. SRB_336]|nr:hypothetical protein B5P43_32795 [Bacillus sp. SRB_336]